MNPIKSRKHATPASRSPNGLTTATLLTSLALAVPAGVAERGQIIVVTFGVVAFSIFAQGLTMPWLLRRWRLTGSPDAEH